MIEGYQIEIALDFAKRDTFDVAVPYTSIQLTRLRLSYFYDETTKYKIIFVERPYACVALSSIVKIYLNAVIIELSSYKTPHDFFSLIIR